MGVCDFFFARGFATSRAVSMKSCATGLIVRFFRVTTPTGMSAIAGLTGKTLISGCWLEKRNIDACSIVRKRPAATRLIRAWALSVVTVARG
jgi:hypothetical protein